MMSKFLLLLVTCVLSYRIGIYIGKHDQQYSFAKSCDKDMSAVIDDSEYVCMKVAADGLAKNNVELKEQYKF